MRKISVAKNIRLGWFDIDDSDVFARMGSLVLLKRQDGRHMEVDVVDTAYSNRAGEYRHVMEIILSQIGKRKSWHVDLARLDSRYRGMNIAPKVYTKLIKRNPGFILEAGHMQSPGGQSIWNRLAERKDIFVFARNRKGAYYVEFDEDRDELTCSETKIYGNGTLMFAVAA